MDFIEFFKLNINQIISFKKSTEAALNRLDLWTTRDLLFYKPRDYFRKNIFPSLKTVTSGEYIVIRITVQEIMYPKKRIQPLKIYCTNDTGAIILTFFNKPPAFIMNNLKINSSHIIEGKVEMYDYYLTISHPKFIYKTDGIHPIQPLYSLTYGITNEQLHSYIIRAIGALPDTSLLDENIVYYKSIFQIEHIPTFYECIKNIHVPQNFNLDIYFNRLAYDEILANQISLLNVRKINKVKRGRSFSINKKLQNHVLDKLQLNLTSGQQAVLKEIEEDQVASYSMNRMLQGDVGVGKTLIALLSMLNVLHSKSQCTLMAPTDLLATQHYNFFCKALLDFNINIGLLTGKIKTKEYNATLAKLINGEIDILIGTHALFQENIKFNDLGYIVIDEQHKFGVKQRSDLINKAKHPDLLIMTATPIPRSLALTIFGDMDISYLNTKIYDRKPIITTVFSDKRRDELILSLKKQIDKNEKIYWVCTLIDQNDEENSSLLNAATCRFESINSIYPGKVQLLHSKINPEERNKIMEQFKTGEIYILVSTTVIEVGIDIPDATLIVIEDAQQFGLAQLHQLRRRVGRSHKQSYCVLLYKYPVSDIAKKRLEIISTSDDGFYIAQQDLLLRGGGEILGVKQSGEPQFFFADLKKYENVINIINDLVISNFQNNNHSWISIFSKHEFYNGQ